MGEKKSVCEKSMELMLNIIRISALSLATMSVGDRHVDNGLIPFNNSSSDSALSKSHFMDDKNFSEYIERFHKLKNKRDEVITDGKAAAFIRRFHEKNSHHNTLAAPNPIIVLPPPPPSRSK